MHTSLIEHFMPVFIFIFIYVIVYAVLEAKKVLGENKGIHAIIALMTAFIFSYSSLNYDFVKYFVPPFVLFLVVIVFILLIALFLGIKEESIVKTLGGEKGVTWLLIIIALIIAVSTIANVFGPQLLKAGVNETQPKSEFEKNLIKAFFNEKTLGMILLLLIAFFAVRFISQA